MANGMEPHAIAPTAVNRDTKGGTSMDAVEQARTILVVEDNVLMRKLFVRCLEEGGFTVIEADDPRAVIDLMLDAPPDLVVMDIVMPGVSGVELIRQIRADARLAAIPVVAVTNLATPADKRRLADAGFNGHVSKPIKPKDFLATVSTFLDDAAVARA
jgi:two-component system cell cycle response regulator DivK